MLSAQPVALGLNIPYKTVKSSWSLLESPRTTSFSYGDELCCVGPFQTFICALSFVGDSAFHVHALALKQQQLAWDSLLARTVPTNALQSTACHASHCSSCYFGCKIQGCSSSTHSLCAYNSSCMWSYVSRHFFFINSQNDFIPVNSFCGGEISYFNYRNILSYFYIKLPEYEK